jgi:glutamate-5-semialdehyde dehydrogenase
MKTTSMISHLRQLKAASRELRCLSSEKKNSVLISISKLLLAREAMILKANQADLRNLDKNKSKKNPVPAAFRDRLLLNSQRISQMAEGLEQVAALPDPVGEVVEQKELKMGLHVDRVRSPLGVIFMIFESRPNVVIEAFSLAFKSGNAMILRGGKESSKTARALYKVIEEGLQSEGVSSESFWGIYDPDRAIPAFLLKQKKWIDVVVPRGGEGLIAFVTQNSEIPIIKNDRGMCHVYVHEDADLKMAADIVVNAKTQRPGVCNSMETLLVHQKVAEKLLLSLHPRMLSASVRWHACPTSRWILKGLPAVQAARKDDWDTEYLDFEMNCRVVTCVEEAISHIEEHGSRHSESIVSHSSEVAKKFQSEVDAAVVYWNASTRFTDGFEMGLGGELGISTQKLHVRGPVGLRELTSVRWVVQGNGQIRG